MAAIFCPICAVSQIANRLFIFGGCRPVATLSLTMATISMPLVMAFHRGTWLHFVGQLLEVSTFLFLATVLYKARRRMERHWHYPLPPVVNQTDVAQLPIPDRPSVARHTVNDLKEFFGPVIWDGLIQSVFCFWCSLVQLQNNFNSKAEGVFGIPKQVTPPDRGFGNPEEEERLSPKAYFATSLNSPASSAPSSPTS